MNKKILYPVLVLALGLGVATLIATNKPALDPTLYEPMARTVRVTEVQAVTEHLSISSQGTVQPRSQSELIPEVSGRVVWTSPSLVGGGPFREGDVLLRIDAADYLSAMQRSEATLQRSEVEYSFASDELKRLQKPAQAATGQPAATGQRTAHSPGRPGQPQRKQRQPGAGPARFGTH